MELKLSERFLEYYKFDMSSGNEVLYIDDAKEYGRICALEDNLETWEAEPIHGQIQNQLNEIAKRHGL
jgi:hypothetical protein